MEPRRDVHRHTEVIDGPAGPIEVHAAGRGRAVVLVPSLGRAASDFEDLADRLARAGYLALAPEPRGIGGSAGPLEDLSLTALAGDVASVVATLGAGRATVVGHAFGNRVARMTAARHPDAVDGVALLACGGLIAPSAEAGAALRAVFDPGLSPAEHLAAVRTAFFAPGHDASVWADGWYPTVAAAQSRATTREPVTDWWSAGAADVLVVQPADDVVAVPANGEDIARNLGARASMVTIPDAGHALLPEQPEAVAAALVEWLGRV